MARLRRDLYISAIYHVYNRGNNRIEVFKDAEDKDAFLGLLKIYRERFSFKVYAICLMDNHYHMIIHALAKHKISRIMHALALAYSVHYRHKYQYVGHLWQSRYKSRLIEREEYLMECIEYIHQNPVKANMVSFAADYKYSSAAVMDGKCDLIGEFALDSVLGTVNS